MTSTMVDAVLTSLAQSGLGKLTVGAAMATQEVYNAARLHDCQKLQALLKQGQADINFIHGQSSADGGKSSDFETALMVAVDEGCLACTQSLVQHKATVNWQSVYDGYTAFLVACYHGNMNIGKYLLEQGASIGAALTPPPCSLPHVTCTSRRSPSAANATRPPSSTHHQ